MKRGFTLLEVVVVVAILLILAALLQPVLSRAREAGYKARDYANLHHWAIGLEMYRVDSGGTDAPAGVSQTGFPLDDRALKPTYVSTFTECGWNPNGLAGAGGYWIVYPQAYASRIYIQPVDPEWIRVVSELQGATPLYADMNHQDHYPLTDHMTANIFYVGLDQGIHKLRKPWQPGLNFEWFEPQE